MLIPIISGLAAIRVNISDLVISDVRSGVTASAAYSLTNAAVINAIISAGGTISQGNWITPVSAAGAAYEVRVTNTGDPLFSGTTGSWLALNTTRTWTLQYAGPVGFVEAYLTVEIRRASDSVVLDTASITLHAEKT